MGQNCIIIEIRPRSGETALPRPTRRIAVGTPHRLRVGGFLSTAVLLAAFVGPSPRSQAAARQTQAALPSNRPNILLIISDDQTWSTFNRSLMPSVFSQLVDRGVLFTRGYANESMCCPSRSEILTGLYGQHTGVDSNQVPLTRPTIVQALHDLGYRTMLAGKYLNSWPCNPRPEFDNWICAASGGSGYSLVNPTLNVNGVWQDFTGYTTDILAGYANDFVANTPLDQPFFLMYTPPSPHLPANDDRCFGNPVTPYRPPSFDENTTTDGKPIYMQRGPLSPDEIAAIDQEHQVMTQAVECLDPSVESVLGSLGDREQNTLVFYVSDNGFLYGEHRRDGKQVPYEESVRVPFIVRYPPLLPESQAFASDALVENVDIAPTIAGLLGIHWGADGRSLVPILTGQATRVRKTALIEFCQGVSYPCDEWGQGAAVPPFWGAEVPQYAYVEYATGEKELYDLTQDPYEMTNLDGNPAYAHTETQLAARLAHLRVPPPTDTTIVTGPQGVIFTDQAAFTYFSQSRFATYECRLNLNSSQGTWTPCDGQSVAFSSLQNGDYTFDVRGTDENGVTDPTPDKRSFTVAVP